jgi:hypothetical protein
MSITSANSVLMISIKPLFTTPQQLQGFAADDIFDIPAIQSVETMMGVDGVLSGGFVFVKIPWDVTFQADSASNAIFDLWWTTQQQESEVFTANGFILLPGVATKFTLTKGFLESYKPAPAGKKVLQPRRHQLVFESIAPAPA